MDPSLQSNLVLAQQGNMEVREKLIQQYRPFVIRAASYICKRPIRWEDDESSIGLIALNEAIDRYNDTYGKSFDNFVFMLIRNHLVNEFRKNRLTEPHMSIDSHDEFEHSAIEVASSLEAYEREQSAAELAQELLLYDEVLQNYAIQLEELEDCSPVHRDTRIQLIQIAKQFMNYPAMLDHLHRTKQLPLKQMMEYVHVSRKTLERNRKYLISIILLYSSDEFSRIRSSVSFAEIGE